MPAGRPSKYDQAMCERVIECGQEGMGRCEMAADLGIHYETFEAYQAKHPEFSEAVKAALRLSQAWWEGNGRKATFGGFDGFNATSYIFQMKNRFKEDWRDRKETDLTSSDGSMTPKAGLDVSKLSDAALREIREAANAANG